MKKIYAFLLLAASVSFSYAQQRIAYVDSEYVMKHIPEFTTAQTQLDKLSEQWQKQVDTQYEEIEKLYQAYQNDQSLLNADMRRRREDEIVNKEKLVKDFQKQKFGYEGELFQKRATLINPIQERVSKAINDIAKAQSIDLILDKGAESSFLFANPNINKSNDVIIKLGFKPNASLLESK